MSINEILSAEILIEMRAQANPAKLAGMVRFGIDASRAGKSQPLAEQLWETGIHGARIMAAMIGDPQLHSWDVCDLFDRSPHAWDMIAKWATRWIAADALRELRGKYQC